MTIITFYLVFIVAIICSFKFGGRPEQLGAAFHLTLALFQGAAYSFIPIKFDSVDGISLITDCAGLIAFGWLALTAKRVWPICTTSLFLLSICGHFARWVQIELEPFAYSILRTSPTALCLVLLIAGALKHRKRVARLGHDPSWVDWTHLRSVRLKRLRL